MISLSVSCGAKLKINLKGSHDARSSRLKPGRQSCYLRSKGRGRLRTHSTGCMQLYDLGRQVNIRKRFGMFSRLIPDLFCTKRVLSILIFIYC